MKKIEYKNYKKLKVKEIKYKVPNKKYFYIK